MTALLEVPFRGDTIACVETPERVLVAMKPICERVGLAWQPQHRKLAAEPELWGVTMLVMPSAGGMQETACIPLTRLAAWLFTISPNRVKPELREALVAYRNEAADVLDAHFRLRASEKDDLISHLTATNEACRRHLLANSRTWAQMSAMFDAGLEDYQVAQRMRLPVLRVADDRRFMAECGLTPRPGLSGTTPDAYRDRIRTLQGQLLRERRARREAEAQPSLPLEG